MATTNKYDRQLRLWGAKGQKALSETCVILIHATAAGTETLKNLVLPGIGQVVVLDDSMMEKDACQSNFFVKESSCSKLRGRVAVELLQELNPNVKCRYHDLKESSLMETNLVDMFDCIPCRKRLVIGADLVPPLLFKVSNACHELGLPLVVAQSYGLIGLVRIQTPPLPLLDPKPDSELPDLRLVSRFPALSELANSIPWDSLQSADYGHVPYPLVLIKFVEEWKLQHNGAVPITFAEKQTFQKVLQQAGRKFDQGGALNFIEASNMAYLAYTERTLEKERLQELLGVCQKYNLTLLVTMLQALTKFMSDHDGQVPLSGTIPDMVASTDQYIRLQKIYQTKALQDYQEMRQLVPCTVANDELETLIKNLFGLDIMVTRTIQEEYSCKPTTEMVEEYNMVTLDPYDVPEHTPFVWYLALRACRLFYTHHGRYPGTLQNYKQDIPLVQSCMQQVVQELQLHDSEWMESVLKDKNVAEESCRFANAEIHTVASIVGGVAAQEAVKIITGQYVPLNNTYIYNGIASTGGVYQF